MLQSAAAHELLKQESDNESVRSDNESQDDDEDEEIQFQVASSQPKTALQLPQKFVKRLFFSSKKSDSQSSDTSKGKRVLKNVACQTSDELLDELVFEKLKKAYMLRQREMRERDEQNDTETGASTSAKSNGKKKRKIVDDEDEWEQK